MTSPYPNSALAPRPDPLRPHPELRSVCFSTATIRSGRVAAAKIDCSGIPPEHVTIEPLSQAFEVQVLPTRARQGRFVLLAIRIHRRLGAPRSLCVLRVSAAGQSVSASITVRP